MTYRIEITADSLTELSGKVLALAAQMHGGTPSTEVVAEDKPKPTRKPKAEDKPVEAKAEETPAPEQTAVDFDKDITPKVLKVVEIKGRVGIEAVLSQFGVTKASQVPVDQRGELLAALEAALAETE